MPRFEYHVWFRNTASLPADQDQEWVACFLVDAGSEGDAKKWGDELARSFSLRNCTNEFLSSNVGPDTGASLPVTRKDVPITDDEIGW